MAKYIKQEMGDLDGSGEQKVFYRMQTRQNLNAKQFINKLIHPGSGLTEGNVMHVLAAMAHELAYYMGQGYSVTIDGIGTFKPTIGVAKDKEMDGLDGDEPKRNARSLMVNGVNFRASKELIRETGRHCNLEKGGTNRLHRSPYTKEERLELARTYLTEHHVMRVADYVELTGLSRTGATLELQEARADAGSGITFKGRGSAKVYCLSSVAKEGK